MLPIDTDIAQKGDFRKSIGNGRRKKVDANRRGKLIKGIRLRREGHNKLES